MLCFFIRLFWSEYALKFYVCKVYLLLFFYAFNGAFFICCLGHFLIFFRGAGPILPNALKIPPIDDRMSKTATQGSFIYGKGQKSVFFPLLREIREPRDAVRFLGRLQVRNVAQALDIARQGGKGAGARHQRRADE